MRSEIRTLPFVLCILLSACDVSLFPNAIPTLSNVNGAGLPEGPVGSLVVASGAGFGDVQGSGRVLFAPLGGGVALAGNVVSWTQSAVVVTAPAGAPGSYGVSVQAGSGFGSASAVFNITPTPTFDPSAVTWTAGPALPAAVSGAGVAFARVGTSAFVYVVGGAGAGGAPVTTVSYSVVATDGSLGAWTATTALPVALAFTTAVAATLRNSAVLQNGYVYVLGGATTAGGAPVATVYRAPINTDGSLGSWTTTTALPAPVRSASAIIQYGSLYVLGGANTSNAPVATAYRAPIQPSGNLNSWIPQVALPSPRARFSAGAFGLFLYALGGDSAAIAPNDTAGGGKRIGQVIYANLHPSTRDILGWSASPTELTAGRSASAAAVGVGNVLLVGGLYTGALAHTSEATYASIGANGATETFATAAPATSIFSLCGCNLFNNGGTGYLAGDGSFHVLIAGGDNVLIPGAPRAETFTY